jgi:hypothetical protein
MPSPAQLHLVHVSKPQIQVYRLMHRCNFFTSRRSRVLSRSPMYHNHPAVTSTPLMSSAVSCSRCWCPADWVRPIGESSHTSLWNRDDQRRVSLPFTPLQPQIQTKVPSLARFRPLTLSVKSMPPTTGYRVPKSHPNLPRTFWCTSGTAHDFHRILGNDLLSESDFMKASTGCICV